MASKNGGYLVQKQNRSFSGTKSSLFLWEALGRYFPGDSCQSSFQRKEFELDPK